ncbi:MAG TPA: hypothetical protein VEL74_23970 [Thermoanaerobaculia bacterium]|nr:hypothetical protein [Thermoanaerobaculia bacterium]
MAEPVSNFVTPAPRAATGGSDLARTVLRAAWLSIALGLLIELLIVVSMMLGGAAGSLPRIVADSVQKVSWSTIVCLGIAFGTAAGKARSAVMGILGLISAPIGFTVARTLHKGTLEALGVAGTAAGGASPLLIGGLKGLEYGILGMVIGWVGRQAWGGFGAHAGAGASIGFIFGGAILGVMVRDAAMPLTTTDLIARGINELLFPVGCALVLYAAGRLGQRLGVEPS